MGFIPKKGNKESRLIHITNKVNELEQKIIKNEELGTQKYRALQDFVRLLTNFASHDIKNAVHNMDGLLSTTDINEVTTEDINTLKDCLDNIRNSLEEFKSLSTDVDKKEFKLDELINALHSLHRPLFKKHKIKFNVIFNNVPRKLVINQTFHHILQILNNMLINSFEFLNESKNNEIQIELFFDETNNENLIFLISDTGKGIDSSIKSKIFKAYFTTKNKGSGVGLTHVKHTLEQINGKISLEQESDDFKTVFKITLPLR